MELTGLVVSVDGARSVSATVSGRTADAAALGADAAEQLLARGADDILADVRKAHADVQGLQP
jgi:hydroxymethylbilane synthase